MLKEKNNLFATTVLCGGITIRFLTVENMHGDGGILRGRDGAGVVPAVSFVHPRHGEGTVGAFSGQVGADTGKDKKQKGLNF